jgi:septum formation protein
MANPMEGLPRPLILGSGSFTRKLILKEMGIDFHLLVRPIDERNIGDRINDSPQDLVLALAKAKCNHLVNEIKSGRTDTELPPHSSNNDGWIVLSGDQVVTHNGDILEKPLDVDEARSFVTRYAFSPPSTVGAVCLTHVPSGIQVSGVDSATIVFRPSVADANLVDRLLGEGAPILSCAGGLMVEHPLVREHVERIDGTEDSVMGLSKDLVLELLREMRHKLSGANLQ